MAGAIARTKGLFWHPDENRLRALFRIPVTFGLLLLAARIVLTILSVVDSAVSIPNPLFVAAGTALLAVAVVAIGWFVDRRYLRDLGFERDGQWALDAIAGLAVGVGMVGAVVVTLRATGMATLVDAHVVSDPDLLIGTDAAGTSFLYGLLLLGAAGALEEVLVRGYLLVNAAEGLRGYMPDAQTAVGVGIFLTALVFGTLHAANPGGTILSLPNLALAGVFLGVAYAVTGRLAFPIGVHVAWNVGLGPLFGLPISGLTTDTALVPVRVDGPTLVTGGAFGPEGGVVMLVALAVAAAGLVWWARRQYDGIVLGERLAVPDLWITDEPDE